MNSSISQSANRVLVTKRMLLEKAVLRAASTPPHFVAAMDGQSAALARNASVICESNNPGRPQHLAEVAEGK